MNKFLIFFITIFTLFPLIACSKNQDKVTEIDKTSYIKDFELIQENTTYNNIIKIKSPKAIIDPVNNDIDIYDSIIKISNNDSNDIQIISGKSTLNNSSNLLRVFNNVKISILDYKNYFIKTDSLKWLLSTSNIDLDSPLYINFDNTNIISSSGSYNFKSSILKLNNNIFNRVIFDNQGNEKYQIEIISDFAKWNKSENSLEFISNNKQVQTTVNFLSIK